MSRMKWSQPARRGRKDPKFGRKTAEIRGAPVWHGMCLNKAERC